MSLNGLSIFITQSIIGSIVKRRFVPLEIANIIQKCHNTLIKQSLKDSNKSIDCKFSQLLAHLLFLIGETNTYAQTQYIQRHIYVRNNTFKKHHNINIDHAEKLYAKKLSRDIK